MVVTVVPRKRLVERELLLEVVVGLVEKLELEADCHDVVVVAIVVVVKVAVEDGDTPHSQSSDEAHWQLLVVGSNIVPTAHNCIGSSPFQQL